jgi:hypothetical protein
MLTAALSTGSTAFAVTGAGVELRDHARRPLELANHGWRQILDPVLASPAG